jgi:hypothetical protein
MATEQTIFRVASRHKPYAQLGNAMLRDKRLSLEARGVLAFILSHPSDWHFSMDWLCREQGVGRDKARRIIKEHVAFGYCVRSQERTATGSWGAITYTFTDEPEAIEGGQEPPQPEKPLAVQPAPANPTPTKTVSHKDIQNEKKEGGELPIQPVGTDGASGDRVPFTPDVLAEIAMLGLDAAALIERYRTKTAGRHIEEPSAYILQMARDEAAKQRGVPVAALAGIASGNRAKRAMAQAASVGAAVEPSPAVLHSVERRLRARGQDPVAVIAAWRTSVTGRPVRNADSSLMGFADLWRPALPSIENREKYR